MARPIVTQQAVTEAAQALIAIGSEPSIVAVQSRIGGGSFSTVKRYLDGWKQERDRDAAAAPETPPEVQTKAQEFARAVWALASREAQRDVQKIKDEAHAVEMVIRAELAEASSEIARLEGVESAQAATLEQQQSVLRETELALAQAQMQARRVVDLETTLSEIRAELDASRKDASAKAVEAGRLAGEREVLRSQVRELMAAIKPSQAKDK